MSSSREDSPDWLREFKAPTDSVVTLSDDSNSSPNPSPLRDVLMKSQLEAGDTNTDDMVIGDNNAKSPWLKVSRDLASEKGPKKKRKKKTEEHGGDEVPSEKHIEPSAPIQSVWALSSVSENGMDEDAVLLESGRKSPVKKAVKEKSSKKRMRKEEHTPKKERKINDEMQKTGDNGDLEAELLEEHASEKIAGPQVSSSRLPLVLSDKVQRSKALVECEGDSIDLSGDVGAVGRVVIQDNPAGNNEMYLDLKGTIYKTTIVPSRTFCIVNFGQTEAKVEAIMNDFIQLKPQSNVNEVETMVEGTLEGFSFDSEDEAEKMSKLLSHQGDQNEGPEEQNNGKTKKSSGLSQKKGKAAGKPQPTKKARKKAQPPKKSKTKK